MILQGASLREEGARMYQLIGTAFCVAAAAFAFLGDPIMGLLLVLYVSFA